MLLERAAKAFVAFLSMTGTIFVATTIFYSKKLQAHPMPLIAYICICEALSSFNAMMQSIPATTFVSYSYLDILFSNTFFFKYVDPNQVPEREKL